MRRISLNAWSNETPSRRRAMPCELPRPEYARSLADLEAGAINGLLVYDLDRLHRQPSELEAFIDLCTRLGLTNVASVSGEIDLTTADGQFQDDSGNVIKEKTFVLILLYPLKDREKRNESIEFIRDADGSVYTYDVNTNTNYNPEAEARAGRSAMTALARFLAAELDRVSRQPRAAE